MSKFIDKLIEVSQGGLKPMGFRMTAAAAPRPGMLLVASVAQTDVDHLAGGMAGADAGLLPIPKSGPGLKTLKKACQAMPDIPWGGWLKEVSQKGIGQMAEAGCDFVVFPAVSTSLAVLEEKKLGKVLEVEPGLDPGLLKAVDDLPVDAVLIAGGKPSLTWQDLMFFRRGANILTKPLLVVVSPDITSSELQALREAGVTGVVVEAGIEAGRLAELRQMIDKLPFPSPSKRRKVEPLVPRIRGETLVESEEEEE